LKIIDSLKKNGVVILPTDTLYALAANACDDIAVQKLINIKGRQDNHPLPILVKNLAMAKEYGDFNSEAEDLAIKNWPGALTLVVPIKDGAKLSKYVNQGAKSIAIRVPKSSVVLSIINDLGFPIVGTSANKSGQPNLILKEDLQAQFAHLVDDILYTHHFSSVASTIVDCTGDTPKVLRQGEIKI